MGATAEVPRYGEIAKGWYRRAEAAMEERGRALLCLALYVSAVKMERMWP
jgi:hypothetical protein